jgi:hypothetical protein
MLNEQLLSSSVAGEQPKDDDDRNGNADKPKQNRAHVNPQTVSCQNAMRVKQFP